MSRCLFLLYVAVAIASGWKQGYGQPSQTLHSLTVEEVAQVLDDQDWVIVDTRSSDEYNGWRLGGVSRGGHLPGAVDFPARWLDSERAGRDEILSEALNAKRITPERTILLCGTSSEQRERVADYLRARGFSKLFAFDFQRWAEDLSRALVRYPNYQLLVPPEIVQQILAGNTPETFPEGASVKVVEVSWGKEEVSYSQGHVPNSFHVNTDHFEPPPEWMLGDRKTLEQFAKRYGFHVEDVVVLYGEDPTAAYRLALVLRFMGVRDVRVLNGGLQAWKSRGYSLETKRSGPPEVDSFGGEIPGRAELIDGIGEVKLGLRQPSRFTLVDTRTWAEFVGEVSGYQYHAHKGRIPGAVYGQATFRGNDSLTPYRNIDHTMRNGDEILKLWQESGIDTQQHLSFMCGSGWRAAEVQTFAHVLGLSDASLYSDGWIGWSNDRTNPVESGPSIVRRED